MHLILVEFFTINFHIINPLWILKIFLQAEGPLDYAEYEMMNIETQNNKEIIQPMSEVWFPKLSTKAIYIIPNFYFGTISPMILVRIFK